LRQSARDPALDREISAIESSLFGPQDAKGVAWSPRRLLKNLTNARQHLIRPALTAATPPVLPADLNPIATRLPINPLSRPVAR